MRRLETARRGADLLDRKLRILDSELARLQAAAAEAAAKWDQRQADAQTWLLRATLLGGERAIRLSDDGQAANVRISYETTMGIRYPSEAVCDMPSAATWDGPVVARARLAHRAALAAAAQHAAASAAVRALDSEVTATRYRLRAIQDRWIPRLEKGLSEVTFAIEELERADAARLRLAAGSGLAGPDLRAGPG